MPAVASASVTFVVGWEYFVYSVEVVGVADVNEIQLNC